MGWFSRSRSRSPSRRPKYARSSAGSTYSSSSRHYSSTSHYKRRPRDGYIQYLYNKLRHLLRQLWHYARRHPFKVFFMVIMPLVSGGLLHKLAAKFGVTLPGESMVKKGSDSRGGYYGSDGYGEREEKGGLEGLMGTVGNVAGMVKMAQAFM